VSVEPIQNPRFNSADTSVDSPGAQDLDRLRRGAGPIGQPASNGHATGLQPRRGAASRHYRLISIGQALSDGACILASLMISHYIRYGDVRPMPYGEFVVVLVAPLLWIVVFRSFNLYAPQHLPQQEEFRRVIGAVSLGIVFLVMVSYWTKSSFPRSWIGMTWLLVLFLELGVRQAWAWRQGRLKRDGRLNFRTLIVGTTREAGQLAKIRRTPSPCSAT
jgi:FlaA1/EpsC-like NDP-sugar epimerase